MFIVEALYPFSFTTIQSQEQSGQNQKTQNKLQTHQYNQQFQKDPQNQQLGLKEHSKNLQQSHQQQAESKQAVIVEAGNNQSTQSNNQITYLTFQKGDKILVLQSYDNGWWYGHTLKQPEIKGFFPSNYIQTSAKPKPPPPPPESHSEEQHEENNEEAQQKGVDWVQNELKKITQGPVRSDYYLGIKGYKNVKIDDKNQNVLKGDHVKFDVSTGLAKVPVKDQAPVAKAVRQMGYYFDYHQWNEERNKQPHQKARPDAKKKKIKKLNLKGMK